MDRTESQDELYQTVAQEYGGALARMIPTPHGLQLTIPPERDYSTGRLDCPACKR